MRPPQSPRLGLVEARVERLPERLDGPHPLRLERVHEVAQRERDALADRVEAALGLERRLEVVHDGKDLAQQGVRRVDARDLALALRALPVVVELGEGAQVLVAPLGGGIGGGLGGRSALGARHSLVCPRSPLSLLAHSKNSRTFSQKLFCFAPTFFCSSVAYFRRTSSCSGVSFVGTSTITRTSWLPTP